MMNAFRLHCSSGQTVSACRENFNGLQDGYTVHAIHQYVRIGQTLLVYV
jgi:hypothetical protein